MSIPDFIVIGHLTRDKHPSHDTLGGTATFAAIAARNLGYRAAILTRAAPDFPQRELLRGIEVVRLPSEQTTSFQNVYDGGHRQQFVSDIADPIPADQLPAEWRSAKIALLGPIIGEVDTDMAQQFDKATTLVGVVPQGWLRRWDSNGRVKPRAWRESPDILPYVRVLSVSEEDLGEFTERLQAYCSLTPIVVLTRGDRGCTVYQGSAKPFDSPAFKANQVDPTGAGDVFTAAFLIRLHETNDVVEAARFANCTASFAVEAEGTLGIPTRAQVEERMAAASVSG